MNTLKEGLAVLTVSAFLCAPAALAAPPTDGPVSGPMELHALTGGSTSPGLGGLKVIGMDFAVTNLSADAAIKAIIQEPVIIFSDGSRQRLRGLYHGAFAERLMLEPGSTHINFPLVVIDEDAPAGIATVEFRGHVANVFEPDGSGGGDEEEETMAAAGTSSGLKHSDWAPNNHALSTATFLVLD